MNNPPSPRLRLTSRVGPQALIALIAYQLLAVIMTWPLLPGIFRDVPGDLGDPLLNLWILAWGAESVPRLLLGQMTLQDYWNANIFHPEPLALAFSEHLFGLVLQILPIYHVTGNSILCYNLLVLTSYSLSGLGMFLLVRELLAERQPHSAIVAAAFVAGLVYAFMPFRVAQLPHIQSLSSQWMPLALYGFRRFITTARVTPLAAGSAALLMQNWSCGYYLIYFAPIVPLFVIHQMWLADQLRNVRMWLSFVIAAFAVAAGTFPFLWLYLEAQRLYGFRREIGELINLSADVYAYFTAPAALRLWGDVMQAMPRAEGELFFGIVPMVLAVVALVPGLKPGPSLHMEPRRFKYWLTRLLILILFVQTIGFVLIVFTGGFVTSLGGVPIRSSNANRIAITITVAAAVLLVLSPTARQRLAALVRSHTGLAALLMLFALWMSLGPVPQTRGQLLQVPAIYRLFYDYVPGFEGLRVPARYAMIVGLFLSVLVGFGAARVLNSRRHVALVAVLAVAYLVEVAFVPMPINVTWGGNYAQPPASIEPAADAPAVYHTIAGMPDAKVIAEFPFGDISWELRYVYYATVHWKRLVNGYSGTFPPAYKQRLAVLERVGLHPEEAWRALREAGTTHVIVHRAALSVEEAQIIERWLLDHFAVEIAHFDGDLLFDIDGVFEHRRAH